MRKILFLDIDGVLNSHDWWERRVKLPPTATREEFHKNEFDPIAVERLKRVIAETGVEVVLSSVWRLHEDSQAEVKKYAVDFIDVTPECDSRIRGAEIHMWIQKNVKGYYNEGVLKYAIIDDDGDMLLWQKDNFFQTKTEHGLTDEIADALIQHFTNQE